MGPEALSPLWTTGGNGSGSAPLATSRGPARLEEALKGGELAGHVVPVVASGGHADRARDVRPLQQGREALGLTLHARDVVVGGVEQQDVKSAGPGQLLVGAVVGAPRGPQEGSLGKSLMR